MQYFKQTCSLQQKIKHQSLRMKAKFILSIFCIFFLLTQQLEAQVESDLRKNKIEVMLGGNRGIFSAIYNRTIVKRKMTITMINIGSGFTSGSHDQDTIASVLQMGVGSLMEIGKTKNKIIVGTTFSTMVKLDEDSKNSGTGKYMNGIIFDFGYQRYFEDSTFIKFVFSPVIGNDYRKYMNFPIGFAIGYAF